MAGQHIYLCLLHQLCLLSFLPKAKRRAPLPQHYPMALPSATRFDERRGRLRSNRQTGIRISLEYVAFQSHSEFLTVHNEPLPITVVPLQALSRGSAPLCLQ